MNQTRRVHADACTAPLDDSHTICPLPMPIVKLPDVELQRAVDALREVGAINATVTLTDGRVLTFRGGPFGTVEVTEP